jgi:hypothetical protein
MPPGSGGKRKKHKNDEKTVKCPVEGCEKEVLSRGLHLHVRQTTGEGHGPQDELPEDIDLDKAEEVGSREVEMEYPEERESEQVARLCPYCERPYRGKHGVMIHLGQVAGRKDHPEDAPEQHEPNDFAIVHVDENENVVEVVEEGTAMPSTERRREQEAKTGSLDPDEVQEYIDGLREQGLDEEAERAEQMLLRD